MLTSSMLIGGPQRSGAHARSRSGRRHAPPGRQARPATSPAVEPFAPLPSPVPHGRAACRPIRPADAFRRRGRHRAVRACVRGRRRQVLVGLAFGGGAGDGIPQRRKLVVLRLARAPDVLAAIHQQAARVAHEGGDVQISAAIGLDHAAQHQRDHARRVRPRFCKWKKIINTHISERIALNNDLNIEFNELLSGGYDDFLSIFIEEVYEQIGFIQILELYNKVKCVYS